MAKVYFGFNSTSIEVWVDHDALGIDEWDELSPAELDEAEEKLVEMAKESAEEDGHDLTNMIEAVVGDF